VLFAPFALPFTLTAGLVSILLLGGGAYLLWAWYTGAVVGTGHLIASLAMLALTVAGRFVVLRFRHHGADEPVMGRGGSPGKIQCFDGSCIHVELYGPPDAPPVVLTHGWGMNSTAWHYLKRQLAERFRVIVWDLPGLGESKGPNNNDYGLEKFARDLDTVLEFAGKQQAVLVGHSIGGMITLTWCRLFPERLAERVAGLVLVDTTDQNPIQTTTAARFFRALQRPIIEPLLHVIVWLSPLVWLVNWLSYFNGTAHIVSTLTGFAGAETRGQLEFATRFGPLASPAVLARGVLGMFRFDARDALEQIGTPTLILFGHLDRLTVPEASRFIAQQIPNSELIQLEPGGHVSTLERSREFGQVVSSFARDCADHAAKPRAYSAQVISA
jgi:pimeloyl-ACP methyl ester carboxylesterase